MKTTISPVQCLSAGMFLLLLIASSCTSLWEQQILARDYKGAREAYQEKLLQEDLFRLMEQYGPLFESYLYRVVSLQYRVNRRIDSLASAENWPTEIPEFEADVRFDVLYKSGYYDPQKGAGVHVFTRYQHEEKLISEAETDLLMDGVERVPNLIQSRIILGQKEGIKIPVGLQPDSVMFFQSWSSESYGYSPDLPSLAAYTKRFSHIPQQVMAIGKTYLLDEKYETSLNGTPITVDMWLSNGHWFTDEEIQRWPFRDAIEEDGFKIPSEKTFPTPFKDHLVLVAGAPLQVIWVIGIPEQELRRDQRLSFQQFKEELSPRKRYRADYELLLRENNVGGLVQLFEEMASSSAFSGDELLEIRKLFKEWKLIQAQLQDTVQRSQQLLGEGKFLMTKLNKRNHSRDQYASAYQYFRESLNHDPRNVEAYKWLVKLFAPALEEGHGRHSSFPGLDALTQELNIEQDTLFNWLEQVHAYGGDSLATYEFLIDVYDDFDFNISRKLVDEVGEKFSGQFEAHNFRAERFLFGIIPNLKTYDWYDFITEKNYWEALGTPERVMPRLGDEQPEESVTIGVNGPVTHKERELSSQARKRRQKEIAQIQEKRRITREKMTEYATLAKTDADMMIQQEPRLWKGYWLRAFSNYWLGDKGQSQKDYCKAIGLYQEATELLPTRHYPSFWIVQEYGFKPCGEGKM